MTMKKLIILALIATSLISCKKEGTLDTYLLTVQIQASAGTPYRINAGDGQPQRQVSVQEYTEQVSYKIGNSTSVSALYSPMVSKSISIYISKNGKAVANTSGVGSANLTFIPNAKD